MTEEFDVEGWLEYAKKVAKSFARSFYGDGWEDNWEDIYQEMAILLVTKGDAISASGLTDSYLKRALQNVSHNYCMRERETSFFYSDQYDYRPETVRILLAQYYGGDVKSLFVPDDARTVRGDDNLAMYGDMSRAIEMLPESHQEALERRYVHDEDTDTPAERKALSRAVNRLTKTLNENKVKAEREYNGPAAKRKVAVAA